MYKILFSLLLRPLYTLLFIVALFVQFGCGNTGSGDQPSPRERKSFVTPITDQMIAQAEQAPKVINKKFLADMLRALKNDPESVKYIDEQDTTLIIGCTAMHYAAQSGSIDIVKALLDKGAKANAQDNSKALPLDYGVLNDYLNIVELLLDKGDPTNDLNIVRNNGYTPLKLAFLHKNSDMVKLLIDKGAKIGVEMDPKFKMTALHFAALEGDLEIVRYLVEKKHAEISARGTHQLTPLYLAAQHSHKDVVVYLVKQGAKVDLNQKDIDGRSLGSQITKEIKDLLTEKTL
jgi:ankyrin repeat protein